MAKTTAPMSSSTTITISVIQSKLKSDPRGLVSPDGQMMFSSIRKGGQSARARAYRPPTAEAAQITDRIAFRRGVGVTDLGVAGQLVRVHLMCAAT